MSDEQLRGTRLRLLLQHSLSLTSWIVIFIRWREIAISLDPRGSLDSLRGQPPLLSITHVPNSGALNTIVILGPQHGLVTVSSCLHRPAYFQYSRTIFRISTAFRGRSREHLRLSFLLRMYSQFPWQLAALNRY